MTKLFTFFFVSFILLFTSSCAQTSVVVIRDKVQTIETQNFPINLVGKTTYTESGIWKISEEDKELPEKVDINEMFYGSLWTFQKNGKFAIVKKNFAHNLPIEGTYKIFNNILSFHTFPVAKNTMETYTLAGQIDLNLEPPIGLIQYRKINTAQSAQVKYANVYYEQVFERLNQDYENPIFANIN